MFAAGKTAGVSAGGGTPDPQFNYVTMLLHGDGTNGAQNNTFLDSSTNNFTITRNGNTTQGSFSPYGSNWGVYFGGVGNYLTTATSASGFSFGTGDFTVEFWINSNQTDRCDPVGQDTSYSASGWWGFVFNRSSNNTMEWFENTNSRISATSVTWNNGQWNHVAVTRSGNNVKMFLNGTQVGSTYTTSFTYGDSSVGIINGVLSLGKTDGPLTGYLSNVRIVKGTALYTGTFTPSTTPLTAVSGTNLLTCQANRFFDASTNALAITTTGTPSVQRFNPFGTATAYSTSVIGGSGYFDGGGDYLTTSGRGGFANNTTFTVEFWTYPTSYASNVNWINSSNNNVFYIETFSSVLYVGDGSNNIIAETPPALNQWTHVALAFNGTTYRLYYNGVQKNTSTTLMNGTTFTGFRIGAKSDASRPFYGYITDTRVLVGTNLYPNGTTFTPPTAPLTAITNTAVLLNYTNGAIFDNAMINNLETVGNAQISTSVYKYGTGSLYFDGTGDYLQIPFSQNFTMNGNFTAECWVYVTSAPNAYGGILAFSNDTENVGWNILIGGNTSKFHFNVAMTYTDTATSITLNTWTHLALVRSGSTGKLYINGVADANTVTTSATATCPTNPQIGSYPLISGRTFFGYIDDVRITKGYARYTANFTPPIAAFPNIGPY